MIGDQDLQGKSGVLGLVEIVAGSNSDVTQKLEICVVYSAPELQWEQGHQSFSWSMSHMAIYLPVQSQVPPGEVLGTTVPQTPA